MQASRPASSSDFGPKVHWDHVEYRPGHLLARMDRIELAVHEAAHAVFAAMLGMAVPDKDDITIAETENGAGGVTPIGHMKLDAGAECAEQVVVFVAGHAAVECLMPGLVRSLDNEHLGNILNEVRRRISVTPSDQPFDASGNDEEMALAFLAFCYPNLDDDAVIEHYRGAEALARTWAASEPVRLALEETMTELVTRSSISGLKVRQIAEHHGLIAQGHS